VGTEDTTPQDGAERRLVEQRDEARTENETLKAQLADASLALGDIAFEKQARAHFKDEMKLDNAQGLAEMAVRDSVLKAIPSEDRTPEKLTEWATSTLAALGQTPGEPAPVGEEGTETIVATAQRASGFSGPNLGATGEAGTYEPIVAAPGNPKYAEWKKGKSIAERAAAVDRGELVIPESIKQAHADRSGL